MTMLDRLTQDAFDYLSDYQGASDTFLRGKARELVRSLLAELREPSGGMVDAAWAIGSDRGAPAYWRTMIDAILNEGGHRPPPSEPQPIGVAPDGSILFLDAGTFETPEPGVTVTGSRFNGSVTLREGGISVTYTGDAVDRFYRPIPMGGYGVSAPITTADAEWAGKEEL